MFKISPTEKNIKRLQNLVKVVPKKPEQLFLWANECLQVITQIYGLLWHEKHSELLNKKAGEEWQKRNVTKSKEPSRKHG